MGESSYTESLIYMRTAAERKYAHALLVCRDRKLSQLQETYLFSQLFLYLDEVGKDGEGSGESGGVLGMSTSQACQLASSWWSMTGALGQRSFLQHGVSSPLFQDLGNARESHSLIPF